jgi:hypothetical protein
MTVKTYKKAISSSIILIYIFTTILISLGDRAFASSQQSNRHSASSQQSNRRSDVRATARLSSGHKDARVGDNRYYEHKGFSNQRSPSRYHGIHYPVRTRIWSLPIGAEVLLIGGLTYYMFDDIYYRSIDGGYMVVEPPDETVVVNETTTVVPSEENVGEQVTVTTPLLNIRSGPGMNFPVIYQAHEGDMLTVHGYAPEWLYITTSANESGWVMIKFTSVISTPTSGSSG